MKKQQNIFLVGPMGAGKTTIGRQLAAELSRPFFDSDQVIEERTGVDVAWIYDLEGEEGFREREFEIIDELSNMQGIVLATGGGAVESSDNRRVLAARGIVVYLTVDIDQQLLRMEKDKRRPKLRTIKDRRKFLEEQQKYRDTIYRDISDYVYSTNEESIKALACKLIELLKEK